MDQIQKLCIQRGKELEQIIERASEDIKIAPEGTLHVSGTGKSVQYYWHKKGETNQRIYIKRSEEQRARMLAQKEYATEILKQAQIMKDDIKKLLEIDTQEEFYTIHKSMIEAKRKLVIPYILDDQEYAEQWLKKKRQHKEKHRQVRKEEWPFDENDEDAIITEEGEHVRSKSEKILADKLTLNSIPYVYECPLYLKGYGYIKPDITALNMRTREVVYWEHLGLMDDPIYCEKAIKKIELYEKNGIYPGRGLVLTYETEKHPLNMKVVELLLQQYLI